MQKTVYLVAAGVAIIGVFYLALQPGGRLVGLAAGLFIVSMLFVYFGYFKHGAEPSDIFSRTRLKAAALIGLSLAFLVAYISRQELQGLELIGQWIKPYPHINRIIRVPNTQADTVWVMITDTQDTPAAVKAYYENQKNTVGWEVVNASGSLFVFQKKGYTLKLLITAAPGGSRLHYSLATID